MKDVLCEPAEGLQVMPYQMEPLGALRAVTVVARVVVRRVIMVEKCILMMEVLFIWFLFVNKLKECVLKL